MDWLFDKWYNEHEEPHYTLSGEVQDVLDALPKTHRDVLEARYYERLSYRQLAARFTSSLHPGSGGWVLEKAKRAFKREWEKQYGVWND
jgi:DNA-directed RNA polymerase specialized sigma24 family protein